MHSEHGNDTVHVRQLVNTSKTGSFSERAFFGCAVSRGRLYVTGGLGSPYPIGGLFYSTTGMLSPQAERAGRGGAEGGRQKVTTAEATSIAPAN